MGNEEKATSYVCATCNTEFTPAEARELRSSQADQLRKDLA
jgi:DNA-directed RNA polymerase subunit RPC12/RpoP